MSTEGQFLEAARQQIVAERHAAGLTLDQLAERVQLSRSTLYRLENGRATPDLRQLEELSSIYGMTLMDLMRRIDERADLVDTPAPPSANDYGIAAYQPKIAHESMEDHGEHTE